MRRLPLTLCALLAGGCAPVGQAPAPVGTDEGPFWPAAPEPARVEYLYALQGPRDLDLRKSFGQRLRDLIAGTQEPGLVRPYAVAAREGLIAVTDPGSASVHLFDVGAKEYRATYKAGDAALQSPVGIAIAAGRIYVADSALARVFVLDQRLELVGSLGGFVRPTGVAADPGSRRLFVADTALHHVAALDTDGELLFLIGERGAGHERFNFPTHVHVDGERLFVNDTLNFRIQIFDLDGRHLGSFGKLGDGSGSFAQSKGLAVDSDGHVYVADAMANSVQIFDQQGTFLLGFGRPGSGPGEFQMPAGLAIDADRIYVADSFNHRVQVFRYLGVR